MSTSQKTGVHGEAGSGGVKKHRDSAARRRALAVGACVFVFLALLSALVPAAVGSTLSQAQKDLNAAHAQLSQFQDNMNALAADYAKAEARQATLDDAVTATQNDIANTEKDLVASQQRLGDRLASIYKRGFSTAPLYLEVLLSSADLTSVLERLSLLSRLAAQDQTLYTQVKDHLDKRKVLQQQLVAKQQAQSQQVAQMKTLQASMESKMGAASAQYKALKSRVASLEAAAAREAAARDAAIAAAAARAAAAAKKPGTSATTTTTAKRPPSKPPVVKPGSIVFPVDGPHSYTDTFGAPRSGGRTHKGCDIMAARGTPVVASVSGRIKSLSRTDTGLSGLSFWISGDNGTGYFGCHLDSLVPGIQVGSRVVAGQLLGYVGNTGNAAGGPCHLHFEIHPGGGAAVDPYPILRAND